MPPPILLNLDELDLGRTLHSRDEIYARLPHRYEFQLLDGISFVDGPGRRIVAYADIRSESWWVRGHVRGRPLLPGVLMLEMAAQTSAVLAKLVSDDDAFIAFGGIDDCKFRETVTPPARLYLLCVGVDYRARRIVSATQGVVDGKLVFEAKITGMALRPDGSA